MTSVSVIGAGAWGTALAMVTQRAGSQTTLCSRNEQSLKGYALDPSITLTTQLDIACQADILVMAVPAQVLRSLTLKLAPYLKPDTYVIVASKGIEVASNLLMSEVLAQTLPDHAVGVISGPNFALEIIQNLPTATCLAAQDRTTSNWLAHSFNSPNFRVDPSTDLIGLQVGGALKNVIAIACGILVGRGLGDNACAFLLNRGLTEVMRFAVAKGGKAETLLGLSGIGDLCLTCTSEKSRNRTFGKALGSGTPVPQALKGMSGVIEGVATAKSVAALAQQLGLEMPICFAVEALLHHDLAIDQAIASMLAPSLKSEFSF